MHTRNKISLAFILTSFIFMLVACDSEQDNASIISDNPLVGNEVSRTWQLRSRLVNGQEQIKDCERNNLITFFDNEQFQEFYVCENITPESEIVGFWLYETRSNTLILRRDIYGILQEQAYEVNFIAAGSMEWAYLQQDSVEVILQYDLL